MLATTNHNNQNDFCYYDKKDKKVITATKAISTLTNIVEREDILDDSIISIPMIVRFINK